MELGCIHRGYKWETLNLKKYDAAKAIKTIALGATPYYYLYGGGDYSVGDANILDQIKMTSEPESSEKINLRSKSDCVLSALFRNIQYGCLFGTVSSMTNGTGTIAADSYRNAVKGKYSTANDDNMRTRASVVDVLIPPSVNTDAEQEEIIGKIINLTKVETPGISGFTVYIISQTIKDIGGNGSNLNITKTSADGSATQSVPCQLGRFDVVGPTGSALASDWRQNVYGDEITGEQKVKVRGVVSNGKIKITSFKYID